MRHLPKSPLVLFMLVVGCTEEPTSTERDGETEHPGRGDASPTEDAGLDAGPPFDWLAYRCGTPVGADAELVLRAGGESKSSLLGKNEFLTWSIDGGWTLWNLSDRTQRAWGDEWVHEADEVHFLASRHLDTEQAVYNLRRLEDGALLESARGPFGLASLAPDGSYFAVPTATAYDAIGWDGATWLHLDMGYNEAIFVEANDGVWVSPRDAPWSLSLHARTGELRTVTLPDRDLRRLTPVEHGYLVGEAPGSFRVFDYTGAALTSRISVCHGATSAYVGEHYVWCVAHEQDEDPEAAEPPFSATLFRFELGQPGAEPYMRALPKLRYEVMPDARGFTALTTTLHSLSIDLTGENEVLHEGMVRGNGAQRFLTEYALYDGDEVHPYGCGTIQRPSISDEGLVVFSTSRGSVYAYDSVKRELVWHFDAARWALGLSRPATISPDGTRMVVGTGVFALSPTPELLVDLSVEPDGEYNGLDYDFGFDRALTQVVRTAAESGRDGTSLTRFTLPELEATDLPPEQFGSTDYVAALEASPSGVNYALSISDRSTSWSTHIVREGGSIVLRTGQVRWLDDDLLYADLLEQGPQLLDSSGEAVGTLRCASGPIAEPDAITRIDADTFYVSGINTDADEWRSHAGSVCEYAEDDPVLPEVARVEGATLRVIHGELGTYLDDNDNALWVKPWRASPSP